MIKPGNDKATKANKNPGKKARVFCTVLPPGMQRLTALTAAFAFLLGIWAGRWWCMVRHGTAVLLRPPAFDQQEFYDFYDSWEST